LDTSSEYYKKHEVELYIETASGRRFFIDRPEFHIVDIAHALAHQCRYTGHPRRFYSVAEHSILVSHIMRLLELGDPFEGLMHDGAEAYLSDIAAPWKGLLPDYKKLEQRIEIPMRRALNLPDTITDGCKQADWIALFIEARHLMPSKAADWIAPPGVKEKAAELTNFQIHGWNPTIAGSQFMNEFVLLRPELYVA
jgi:hypothetical protein